MKLFEQIKKNDLAMWGLFLGLEMFLLTLMFVRFPWNGSFFSDVDIWFYVLQLNDFYLNLTGNAQYGDFFFPEPDYQAIMDSPFGLGSMILPFKFFFSNDLWAYFFFTVFILAMDGLAVAVLAKALGVERWIAMVFGFLFVLNNFMMSQVDNFNSIAMFPGVFAAYFLHRFFISDRKNAYLLLALSAYLAGYQLYVSIYHFVFQFLLFLMVALFAMKWRRHWHYIPAWGFLLILLAIPFFLQHGALPVYLSDPAWLAPQTYYTALHSIHFKDLFRAHPGNILYSPMEDIFNPWRYGARSAFVGYLTYILAFISVVWLWKNQKRRWVGVMLLVMVLAFIMASGPFIDFGIFRIKTPAGWVYSWMPGSVLFRHLFRGYHYVPMVMMLVIAYGLSNWKPANTNWVRWVVGVFSLFFLLENVPWASRLHESHKFIEPPTALEEVMDSIADSSNVYFLPSCEQFKDEVIFSQTMNPHSREFIYANWKLKMPINTFNGRLAYLTEHSFHNNQLLCRIDSISFANLLMYNDIDYIIVAKEYTDQKFREKFSPLLKSTCPIVVENARFVVYDPKPYSLKLFGLSSMGNL